MLLRLTVILFLCACIGVHSTDTDAAPVGLDTVENDNSQGDDLSIGESREEFDSLPSHTEEEIHKSKEEAHNEPTEQEIVSPEELLNDLVDSLDIVESDDVTAPEQNEEQIKEEAEEEVVPAPEEVPEETEERVENDDALTPEQNEESIQEENVPEEPEATLTEEDRAQICIAKEIDCHFTQPLTLYGIEMSINGHGKSAADICGELKAGDRCLQEILEGECVPYLLENEQLKRDQQAPIIKYFCDDNLQAVEENWQCLKSSLTEANLNSCSEFNPQNTCEVSKLIQCLGDQFSDECTDEAQELFKRLFTDLASLKLEDCAEDYQVPKTKEGGGFFDFF